MYPHPDIQSIVEALVQAIRETLKNNLEGIYLRGSLVTGDFDPLTSDVDLLIVVNRDLNQADFDQLDAMHKRIQILPNRYSNEIELAYVPTSDVNGFEPGKKYISIERGELLRWKQLRYNWVVEFWSVREQGIALFGPDPKTFIEPIPMERVTKAIRLELGAWQEYVKSWDSPSWQTHAGEMRFAVETMCRVMYTLELHQLCSKPVAVRWALEKLEEPWIRLIRKSQSWQGGGAVSPLTAKQTSKFVRWVIAKETT
jgi:predicted nucleotidyltransferase